MPESLTVEQSDALEKKLNTIPSSAKPFPVLERTSRFGDRESFLERALELFTKVQGPVVYGDFFGGQSSHITFRCNSGKIYSWIEIINGDGYSKENVRVH